MMDDNAVSCGQFGKKRLPTMEWNFAPGNCSKKIFIAPPRIVLLQNSSKFLALHHFDIGTNIEYVSKSTDFAYTTFLNNINWH